MVEVMKIMAASFKRSHAHTATLSAPDPTAGHHQSVPLPDTPGHSWASLGQSLVGSLLLSPRFCCTQGFVCALQDSVSPVLCKFQQLSGGVWRTPPRGLMPYACLHPEPLLCIRPLLTHTSTRDTQTLKSRSGSVSVGSPGVDKVSFEPSKYLWWVWGFILNMI